MQLLLLRHAEAEPDPTNDRTRALTEKGRKQSASIGRFCAGHRIVPEIILTSPLLRAEETAKIVAHELKLPERVHIEEFLRPGMTAERALSVLEKHSEKASVMLVGHEPDFSNLAGTLIGGHAESVHFRKATLMNVSLQKVKPGAGRVEFLIPVKCL
jgi:phosphohistidine phosphatase